MHLVDGYLNVVDGSALYDTVRYLGLLYNASDDDNGLIFEVLCPVEEVFSYKCMLLQNALDRLRLLTENEEEKAGAHFAQMMNARSEPDLIPNFGLSAVTDLDEAGLFPLSGIAIDRMVAVLRARLRGLFFL